MPRKLQEVAVDVELGLSRSCVADPDRPRATIPRQPLQLEFRQSPLSTDAVHDQQIIGASGRTPLDEAAEAVRLGLAAELAQRANGEDGVPDPAVAVVPVPSSSGSF